MILIKTMLSYMSAPSSVHVYVQYNRPTAHAAII